MKKLSTLLAFTFLLSAFTYGQECDSAQIVYRPVRASDTDPNIDWELSRHHTYINPDCTPKNKLLFYIGGTYSNPGYCAKFLTLAANNGYHVIDVKYINDVYASQFCGTSTDSDCFKNFRHEHLYGDDLDANIDIDTSDCLMNRSVKLITYMEQNYPGEGWGQFVTGNELTWNKVVVSGHSQGSGHAAYIAQQFQVDRAIMYAGPNEFSQHFLSVADWLSDPFATPDSSLYSFGNLNDEIAAFERQQMAHETMGMDNYGDSLNTEGEACPYQNHRILYTNRVFSGGGLGPNHGSMVSDTYTPLDGAGSPEYADVWRYLLGVCSGVDGIDDYNTVSFAMYPNPSEGSLTIELDDAPQTATLQIYDFAGRAMSEEVLLNQQQAQIDLPDLTSGIYLVTIQVGDQRSTRKLTIR